VPHTAVVVFTARPLDWILKDGGTRDWRLDSERAARAEFAVCTQNRHNAEFGAPAAPHGAAFLIGRISAVVPSEHEPGRWLIKFGEYSAPNPPVPNIWGKSGHTRYPVRYTTLEDLGIDLATLPPSQPLPPQGHPTGHPSGLSDIGVRLLVPPAKVANDWRRHQPPAEGRDVGARLDGLLAQFDRLPDRPDAIEPLAWDEHGLPR
jgi:hypothetical protein